MKNVISLVGVSVVLGLLTGGSAAFYEWQKQNTLSWHKTEGEVVGKAGVSEDPKTPYDGIGRPKPRYRPSVKYVYKVAGVTHRGERISIDKPPGFTTPNAALEAAARSYPAGSKIVVFYDPANPASAVLVVKSPDWTLPLFGGIVTTTVSALICMIWIARDGFDKKEKIRDAGN